MNSCGMKLTAEGRVANIDLMVWSDRLDLLALSNNKGDVQIHRLEELQKVLTFPPPEENDVVKAIAWRPDGKAIAIGYASGCVCIVDIEDKSVLDKFYLKEECITTGETVGVTFIAWPMKSGVLEESDDFAFYDDPSIFLPNLPPMNSGYKNQSSDTNNETLKEVPVHNQFSLLMVGYGYGQIDMRVFGKFKFGTIRLSQFVTDSCGKITVHSIIVSEDFGKIHIVYSDNVTNELYTLILNSGVLREYSLEVVKVANKYNSVVNLMSYLDQTMVSMCEAWEHILLEMDTKMADYAASVPEGGVSADFLELLMFGGVPSQELEIFLLRDLTAKGLGKFGSSVELSYSTIQKLVFKQLHIVGQSLIFYLSELRGLVRMPDRYKLLGLDEEIVTEAIKASYAFLNKCLELQQVIDVSMRNYKTFFRWLFVVMVRLLDEQTPSDIVKITQQDLTHIAEFLYNFDHVKVEGEEKPARFNLERLGQYLQDEDLKIVPEEDENPWKKFLEENPCFEKVGETIFPIQQFKNYSLVQQQKHLKVAVDKVFVVADKNIEANFHVQNNFKCYDSYTDKNLADLRFSQYYDVSVKKYFLAVTNKVTPSNGFYFLSYNEERPSCVGAEFQFSPALIDSNSEECLTVLDLKFYSNEYLSVLMKHPEDNSTVFIQLPVKLAIENASDFKLRFSACNFDLLVTKNLTSVLEKRSVNIINDGNQIAVTGIRNNIVVFSKAQMKVRIYVIDVDDSTSDDDGDTLDESFGPKSRNADVNMGDDSLESSKIM